MTRFQRQLKLKFVCHAMRPLAKPDSQMVQVAHRRVCGCKRPGQSENLDCPFQPVQKTVTIMIRILNIASCFRL